MRAIVLILLLSGSITSIASPVRITELSPGERLDIVYTSRGCFHDRTFDFAFERRTSGITCTVSGRSVTLTPDEVTGIDNLLQFYRSEPPGGCTTQDIITITRVRSGKVLSREEYVDGSCATDDMKDVTRFYTLVRKLGVTIK